MNTIKVKLIFKSGDRHITGIMGDPQQNVHDANLNQIYENVETVCEQVDFEFEGYCNLWPLLYNYWSELKELSLNLDEEGDQQIVVFDIFRDVDIQRRNANETWVYCVTNPIDWGRIISIQGPVEEERPVFLSFATRTGELNHPNVKHFDTPILGMDGNQAWVTANSNTIYFMEPHIYAFNTRRINNTDMRQRTTTLGQGLLALRNQLDELEHSATQNANRVQQHYSAQNQVNIQNVESPPVDIPLDNLLELDTLSAEHQKEIQNLVNILELPNDDAFPEAADVPVEVDANNKVRECLQNCINRIDQSYPQIVQLLQEVYQLCLKMNRIEREMPHAVNIVLSSTGKAKDGHLFLPRRLHQQDYWSKNIMNETMIDLKQNDFNFETQGLNGLIQFVNTGCDQVDNQIANRGYLVIWQAIHEQWSKLEIFPIDLSLTGNVTPFVYRDILRHLRVLVEDNHIRVLCVTQPQVDYGRILYIEGKDPTVTREILISIAHKRKNEVQRFERDYVRNIEGDFAVVNGNTLYLMDRAIRNKNEPIIKNPDLVIGAKILRNGLPLLRAQLQNLNNICDQIEQHFEAQNQQGILMAPDDALLVIDGCRARIQQSLQPIDQILDLLLPLYRKRNTIEKQTEGAVDCYLPCKQILLDTRKRVDLGDVAVDQIPFPEQGEGVQVIQNADQNQILENMDTDINETMVEPQQSVYNFGTQGFNGLIQFVNAGCDQVDNQFTTNGFEAMWQTLHNEWSKLDIISIDLSEPRDVDPFVYKNRERYLKVAKDEGDIWVMCVTKPVDAGRILKIEGNVPALNRKVSLSVAQRGDVPIVKNFDRSKYKEFVLNMEDRPPVVNGNTLYMMDHSIRKTNNPLIDRLDLLNSANTLRDGLSLLREKLEDLYNLCYFAAQNALVIQIEEPIDTMGIDNAMQSMLANWQQNKQVIQNAGQNQLLENIVPPDVGAVELHIPEGVQVNQDAGLLIDQMMIAENAQLLQNAQQVIDSCCERIQQSLQPIDQILELLLPLCQKRQTIKEQTAGAVNLVLPSGYNLLNRRGHLVD